MRVIFLFPDQMGGQRKTVVDVSDNWDGNREYSIGSTGGNISHRNSVINNTMHNVRNMLLERSGSWGAGHLSTLKGDKDILYVTISGMPCVIQKDGTRYRLNGIMMAKQHLLYCISKAIYASCRDLSIDELTKYLYRIIEQTENITYALENRTPYKFVSMTLNPNGYERSTWVDCRLNVEMTEDGYAIEISDGVWGSIDAKSLNTFIETYRFGRNRGNWRLRPEELWSRLIGEKPTSSQLKLMMGFLAQNRTSEMVADKSKAILKRYAEKYDWCKLTKSDGIPILYVRGKLCDWKITARTHLHTTGGAQSCTIQYFQPSGSWSGPFCVNNTHHGSCLGDQMVCRAMALRNDDKAKGIVHTLNITEGGRCKVKF